MKYDTIIIGGGLSGLVAGIELGKAGFRTAIITSGQSALHFCSGSFGLLGRCDGHDVSDPVSAMCSLKANHPYSRIGAGKAAMLAERVPQFFAEAGLHFEGSARQNHYRLTPVGLFRPAWLSASECAISSDPVPVDWGLTAIVGIKGYLDFYPGFLASNLTESGVKCINVSVSTPELDKMRKNSTEMRAPGIARVLSGDALIRFAGAIADAAPEAETIIIPAVVGLEDDTPVNELRKMTGKRVMTVPTQPTSVTGIRIQRALRRYYEKLGGTYLLGDNVTAGHFSGGRMMSLDTDNFGNSGLSARYYILATGSFFSRGLEASPSHIYEPIFGLDVSASEDRSLWYSKNIFDEQPYMSYGVTTDGDFHVFKDGSPVANMLAAGAVLGGCNSLKEGSGAGVAVLTAMEVAERIKMARDKKDGTMI